MILDFKGQKEYNRGMKKKKYWYHITTWYCPVCGKEKISKTRKYTKKPKDYNKIYEILADYDYCDV